ncbi:hypothetical protein O6H91_04G110900 [Diphasiastrum complanatum]|uniref:Uncharacterized protein n=1 Tax=Diphasiastrum complanatum TaxID=34168 RepID=A0ACC2E0Y5_DIPCM|nr:hypothetical protein O6H91_04G110900 [Diphasiastrum complanatum]
MQTSCTAGLAMANPDVFASTAPVMAASLCPSFLFEACVDSLFSALQAQQGGAGRLELCSNLLEGGMTPSYGLIKAVKEQVQIPVHVLIRPRAGDFCYTDLEIKVMQEDIEAVGRLGVEGVVLGILNIEGHIHTQRVHMVFLLIFTGFLLMKEMAVRCERLGLSLTFHRAFDCTADAIQALETLIDLQIPRVLTSGQHETVIEGIQVLQELVELAKGRISILPGGGITESNAAKVVSILGVGELHGTARSLVKSGMSFTNTRIADSMGMSSNRMATDAVKVRKIINACMQALSGQSHIHLHNYDNILNS